MLANFLSTQLGGNVSERKYLRRKCDYSLRHNRAIRKGIRAIRFLCLNTIRDNDFSYVIKSMAFSPPIVIINLLPACQLPNPNLIRQLKKLGTYWIKTFWDKINDEFLIKSSSGVGGRKFIFLCSQIELKLAIEFSFNFLARYISLWVL